MRWPGSVDLRAPGLDSLGCIPRASDYAPRMGRVWGTGCVPAGCKILNLYILRVTLLTCRQYHCHNWARPILGASVSCRVPSCITGPGCCSCLYCFSTSRHFNCCILLVYPLTSLSLHRRAWLLRLVGGGFHGVGTVVGVCSRTRVCVRLPETEPQ